jgi:hypothetical protein
MEDIAVKVFTKGIKKANDRQSFAFYYYRILVLILACYNILYKIHDNR